MSQRVFIAGIGAISSIGMNIPETLASLESGQAGMASMHHLVSAHKNAFPVAEVKAGNEELAAKAGLKRPLSRTAMLSLLAASEALNSCNISDRTRLRCGFISANTVGGMDRTEEFFSDGALRLRDIANHECGAVTDIVAEKLGLTDVISTISTACSSSANSIFYAARLIRHGYADLVVAGGVDSLTKFTLNGFNTLMILDREACRPFDQTRKGLNLGEGAGYLVMVSERVLETCKLVPLAVLSGYANANDAYHQTASSPDGTGSYLAMKGAIQRSGLEPSDIDYINLHGTGTSNNDLSEGTAITRLFGERIPFVGSTKTFTGHTLGASGGLEAVFSVLALKEDMVFPHLRHEEQMKEISFKPQTSLVRNANLQHVMSNSFGFGGNCSSLIFSKQ